PPRAARVPLSIGSFTQDGREPRQPVETRARRVEFPRTTGHAGASATGSIRAQADHHPVTTHRHWGDRRMNASSLIAILLIVAGVLALAYGGFTYTKKTHEAQIGSLELSVQEKETVNVPMWAGVAAIIGGAVLLLLGAKRR